MNENKEATKLNVILRKIIAFSVVILAYYNICFLIFMPEIYNIPIYQIFLIFMFLVVFIDMMLRPISEKREADKYSIIMVMMFLLAPFLLILTYYESKFIISKYFVFWNNFVISYFGILIYIISGIIVIVSRKQLGRYGSGSLVIEDNHKLITKGMYRYIRHPMYLGGLLSPIGTGLVFRTLIMPVLVLILYFLVFKHRMDLEERILTSEFGEEYLSYMKRTKRLIPFFY